MFIGLIKERIIRLNLQICELSSLVIFASMKR